MDDRKSSLSRVDGTGHVNEAPQVPQSDWAGLEKGAVDPNHSGSGRGSPSDPEPDSLAIGSVPLGLIPSAQDPHETYPEGGREAWLVVFGSWLALFSSLGLMNILATFQAYVSTHQLSQYDEGTTGWIFSLYTFLCFFLGIYIGPIFDKYGPRWLILSGTLSMAVSLMLLSICTRNSAHSPP